MSNENPEVIDNSKGQSAAPCGTGDCRQTHHKDKDKNSADKNKLANATAKANSNKETAEIHLRGYPQLKAKITIMVLGVGAGSGKWYVEEAVQEWHVDKGYYSMGKLSRGSGGGTESPTGKAPTQQGPPPTSTPGSSK